MDDRKVNIVACLILVVLLVVSLGGFAYAYLDKIYLLYQTKNYFQSLGFEIGNMPEYYPLFIKAFISVADIASFASIGRQYNITTILESGYSFFLRVDQTLYVYTYTPSNSTWWIWK